MKAGIAENIRFCYVQKSADNQASCEGCLFNSVFRCSSTENAARNTDTSQPLWQSLQCIIITYILRKNTAFYKILQHIYIWEYASRHWHLYCRPLYTVHVFPFKNMKHKIHFSYMLIKKREENKYVYTKIRLQRKIYGSWK